ncbi:MAG: hypothetical protein JO220_00980 [Hyphomicrobiales bacterium]|nr:hypothetical protein [Hyphomicrobiales bacterium]
MKIQGIKDQTGKLIATYEEAAGGGPSVAPVLAQGHTVHQIDVADNYKTDIKGFYEKFGK